MKKKIFGFVLMMSISLCSYSQITFQKTYGGNDLEYLNSSQQTYEGGYIFVGTTKSFGAGQNDIFLIKTDTNGDTLWTKTYGDINDDIGLSIQQTLDSGYIIGGFSNLNSGNDDIYLIKTDLNGDTLWTKIYDSLNDEGCYSIQQTTDGGYIIVGHISNSANSRDVYLVKTDNNGDLLWTKRFGAVGDEFAESVQQTTDGGYIITGASLIVTGSLNYDVYLIKTDINGNAQWLKTYGGTAFDRGTSVKQTIDGGYIITGTCNNLGAGNADVYLSKLDANGDTLWTKNYGGLYSEEGTDVQQTIDSGYIITGYTNSFGGVGYDVYLLKTDASGNMLWSKTYGGANLDVASSVQQTTDLGYIIGGFSDSFGAGFNDFFLIKTDSLGNSLCNRGTPLTVVTSTVMQVSSLTAIVTSPTTTITSSTAIINSGSMTNNLCATTSINPLSSFQSMISIFPNPSSGVFTISFSDNFLNGEIEIYSVLAEKIYSDKLNMQSRKEINLKRLGAGIYFVKVFDGKKSYCKKLIIE